MMFGKKNDYPNHLKMELMSSEMKLREERPDQARDDHRSRFIVHLALLLILLWILSRILLRL